MYVCMNICVYFLRNKNRTNIIAIKAVIPIYMLYFLRQISGQISTVIVVTDIVTVERPNNRVLSPSGATVSMFSSSTAEAMRLFR